MSDMIFTPGRGFTLIEILVVVTIISIMAGTVTFFALQGSQTGRDADRQSDLRALQAAVEAYKRDNGQYPAGCNADGSWSGEQGTAFACAGGSHEYIIGLAPQYIRTLPRDPNLNACSDEMSNPPTNECGYAYVVNATREVYKIIAMNTVEGLVVTPEHPMASCDISAVSSADIRRSAGGDGWCGAYFTGTLQQTESQTMSSDGAPSHPMYRCNINSPRFQNSFAVWGGFIPITTAVCDSAGRCLDPATNPAVDPLENFRLTSYTEGVKRSLRVMAVGNTAAIICQ